MTALTAFILLCIHGSASGLKQEARRQMPIDPMAPDPTRMQTCGTPMCVYCPTMNTDVPELCPQGNTMWEHEELKAAIPEFSKVYAQRPFAVNKGGMNVNNAFSLWFTVMQLQPKHIIESGVHHGQTTWLLRQAAPEAQIYSLDPVDVRQYFDANNKTQYFVGDKFQDLADMDWDSLIPKIDRADTLVMLDDHMSSVRRSKELLKSGFVHAWYDDNYNTQYPGPADCYSFNTVCTPAKSKTVKFMDHFGQTNKAITAEEHHENSKWLSSHLEIYFEFPALFDGCVGDPIHTRDESLLSESELLGMGLPSIKDELYYYLHLYPPYVKLKP